MGWEGKLLRKKHEIIDLDDVNAADKKALQRTEAIDNLRTCEWFYVVTVTVDGNGNAHADVTSNMRKDMEPVVLSMTEDWAKL